MFDRLSSLVIALTLIAIAAILAALAGGDSLTIAILAAAGLAAPAIVHAAAPAPLTKARAETAASPPAPLPSLLRHPDRSEERRVGKEGVRTGSSRWSPDHKKKKNNKENKL